MSGVGFAAGVLAASLALTYLFCLRPMRRGHCAAGGLPSLGRHPAHLPGQGTERDAEVARLRRESAALRAEHPDSGASGSPAAVSPAPSQIL